MPVKVLSESPMQKIQGHSPRPPPPKFSTELDCFFPPALGGDSFIAGEEIILTGCHFFIIQQYSLFRNGCTLSNGFLKAINLL